MNSVKRDWGSVSPRTNCCYQTKRENYENEQETTEENKTSKTSNEEIQHLKGKRECSHSD